MRNSFRKYVSRSAIISFHSASLLSPFRNSFTMTDIDIPIPGPLDVKSSAAEWLRWKRSVDLYICAKNIRDDQRKKAILLTLGGIKLQDVFFAITEHENKRNKPEDQSWYDYTVELLDAFFTPKRNATYERHVFRQIRQQSDETVERYVNRLRCQAIKCEFDDVDKAIIDQVIEGCSSTQLRNKYLQESDLTLKRIYEISKDTQPSLDNSESALSCSCGIVDRISSTEQSELECNRCEGLNDESCPANNLTCDYCHQVGHLVSGCQALLQPRQKRSVPNDSNTNELLLTYRSSGEKLTGKPEVADRDHRQGSEGKRRGNIKRNASDSPRVLLNDVNQRNKLRPKRPEPTIVVRTRGSKAARGSETAVERNGRPGYLTRSRSHHRAFVPPETELTTPNHIAEDQTEEAQTTSHASASPSTNRPRRNPKLPKRLENFRIGQK